MSTKAAIDTVAADWQTKLPVVVPYDLSPEWEDSQSQGAQIRLTQSVKNSGESPAVNLHFQWGIGPTKDEAWKRPWANGAWEGATVTDSQIPYDSHTITLDQARDLAAISEGWYECGQVTYEDQFPPRMEWGHIDKHHVGQWCIRITNFRFTGPKDVEWKASVICVDAKCNTL